MKLPAWIMKWLNAYNINFERFRELLDSLQDKIDLPDEWKNAVSVWLDEHGVLNTEVILAFVTLVYVELKSGAPGYHKDHGGLA